ncbi:MAG: enoyl-CoA hydratase/isomerase family protein [Pseudomonadota bacterium]
MAEVIRVTYPELKALLFEPNVRDAMAQDIAALLIELSEESVTESERQQISQWVTQQPLPIIGRKRLNTPIELETALDIIVASDEEESQLLNGLLANPETSAVLVQTIRCTVQMPISIGLTMESLAYSTLQGGREFEYWLEHRQPVKQRQTAANPVEVERAETTLNVRLNSPENRNALSVAMRDSLADTFKLVAMDASIQAAQVTGNGPSFCAGGDLSEFGSNRNPVAAHLVRNMRMPAQYLAQRADIYTFNLHGACIGAGIEMPAFAGKLIADKDTFFVLPEVGMGLIPGAGGCVSIPRRMGRQRTNFMAITGKQVSATEALAWGLIDEIKP